MRRYKEIVGGVRVKADRSTGSLTNQPDTPKFPHWGGKHGRIKGTVVDSFIDGDSDHMAVVMWDNGSKSNRIFAARLTVCKPFHLEVVKSLKRLPAKARNSKYTKYFIMLAVAMAVDHFFLKGAFRHRFVTLAEKTVNSILGLFDKLISKFGN